MQSQLGEHDQARLLFGEARDLRAKRLGTQHPDYARSLNNLGTLLLEKKSYSEASRLLEDAGEIQKKSQGEEHPSYALSLNNLGLAYESLEQLSQARDARDRSARLLHRHVLHVLPGLSRAEQLGFLQSAYRRTYHGALAFGLKHADDSLCCRASAGWILNGKGLTQEALAQQEILAREARDPKLAERALRLSSVRAALARLTLLGSDSLTPLSQKELERLLQEEERLSEEIGRSGAAGDSWAEVDDLRNALPRDGVLIELATFAYYDTAASRWDRRYAAWIIPPAGSAEIEIVDLGDSAPIEAAARDVQAALQSAGQTILDLGEAEAKDKADKSLQALSDLVLKPLLPRIREASAWLISADSTLWLIPWAALPIGEGQYAIENHRIHYLVSGRYLLAPPSAPQATSTPVIFANPDYDLSAAGTRGAAKTVLEDQSSTPVDMRAVSLARNRLPKAARLPGTAAEAKAVAPKLAVYAQAQPRVYDDAHALEAVYRNLRGPRVLLLSTHGFFLPGSKEDNGAASASDIEPLLRCGLLLAGCNQRDELTQSQLDDGVLTGLEIVGSELRGTKLVVLSACETGLGEVRNGEGVAGLRQAFQLAGAESVVSTLWQISDKESAQLMSDFFGNLAAGQGKANALRNAQLTMIKSRRERYGAAHPFFWAAFTLTGKGD